MKKTIKIIALIIIFITLMINGFIFSNFIGNYIPIPCNVICENSQRITNNTICHFGIQNSLEYVDAPLKLPCSKTYSTPHKYIPFILLTLFSIILPVLITYIIFKKIVFKK